MIFGHVQSCCPELKSLTLLPSSHVAGAHSRAVNNKFFDLDSNLLNYVLFEKDRLDDRRIKKSAQRCITDIRTLLFNAAQYKRIFPNYLKAYGHEWKPVLRVCFLGRWKGNEQVWQIRDANLYPRGFQVMSHMHSEICTYTLLDRKWKEVQKLPRVSERCGCERRAVQSLRWRVKIIR